MNDPGRRQSEDARLTMELKDAFKQRLRTYGRPRLARVCYLFAFYRRSPRSRSQWAHDEVQVEYGRSLARTPKSWAVPA